MEYTDSNNNVKIIAKEISIGKDVSFGKNIDINLYGSFSIGDRSRLGENVKIEGNNVSFGSDLYHSEGLWVGGGGVTNPTANLIIGNRCTIHNNYINIYEKVIIGDDVGLSLEVSIQTHGYWLSVLEGFPAKFAGVKIGDGTIVGFRSTILMGVEIGKKIVIGACSVVTRDIAGEGYVYAGNPARMISKIQEPSLEHKNKLLENIIKEFIKVSKHHGVSIKIEILDYPLVKVNECCIFNVEALTVTGDQNWKTDNFRDFVRKYGLRFYNDRPFATTHHLSS